MKFTPETATTRTTWRSGVVHQRGEKNNAAKLDWHDVFAIRYLWHNKPTAWLCERYRVSPNTIRRVRKLETWKHVA